MAAAHSALHIGSTTCCGGSSSTWHRSQALYLAIVARPWFGGVLEFADRAPVEGELGGIGVPGEGCRAMEGAVLIVLHDMALYQLCWD